MKIRCLVLHPQSQMQEAEVIEWPVVRRSEKNAVLLRMPPGRDVWLRPGDFDVLSERFAYVSPDNLLGLLRVLSSLFDAVSDTLIPVGPAGRGSSAKVRKFKVKVLEQGVYHQERGEDYPAIEKIFTLPVSQIVERDGKHYAPAWLFRRHLRENEEVRGIWPGVDAVKEELEGVLTRLQERLAARVAEWEAGEPERAAEREREAKELRERIERSKEEAVAQEERRRRLAAKVRTPDRVQENCTVTYPEFNTSGRSIRRIGEVTLTGCRVAYFGQKREILTHDGKKIVKLASPNLTVIPSGQSQESPESIKPSESER